MKLIRPITLTQAIVTANSAVNAYPDYAAGTAYAAGAYSTFNQRTYLSLKDANTGHTPGITASAEWWADQGPSNKWAVFDNEVNTSTTAVSPWSFTVSGVAADGISLIDVDAPMVDVVATKDGVVVYSKSVNMLDTAMVTNWAEYFFNPPEFRTELALTDLPPVPGLVITVTLSRPGGGTVSCGKFDCGRVLDVGLEKYGLKREGIDYTNVTFDKFGKATIGTQVYVRKFSTQAEIENSKLDMITRRLDALASTPLVIIGANDLYGSMIVYGLLSYSLDLALPTSSYVSFEAKGLV